MRKIAVSQRVDVIESYDERRDSIDQRWIDFLLCCGFFPVLVPNNPSYIDLLFTESKLDGILLTGGNTLAKLGGDASERDIVETRLYEWAKQQSLPILGVCRGMQLIQYLQGDDLVSVENHICVSHKLTAKKGLVAEFMQERESVCLYHKYGSYECQEEFIKTASSPDGVVLAIEHRTERLFGIMWHPERYVPFESSDIALVRTIFNSQD